MIPILLVGGGFLIDVLAFFPLSVSEWLPRWAQFIVGSLALTAGAVLVEIRWTIRQDRVADEWRYGTEREEPLSYRIASTVVVFDGASGTFSADDQGVYFTEYLGGGEYGATRLVARPVQPAREDAA